MHARRSKDNEIQASRGETVRDGDVTCVLWQIQNNFECTYGFTVLNRRQKEERIISIVSLPIVAPDIKSYKGVAILRSRFHEMIEHFTI